VVNDVEKGRSKTVQVRVRELNHVNRL